MDFTRQQGAPSEPPKNWLVESILATLFCCLPFGVAGIVYATQVNTKYSQGDYEGARFASEQAAKWTKISFFVALGVAVIYIIIAVFFGGWAIWNSQRAGY